MQQVYILCGLPGSGKSTWAKKKVEEDTSNKTIIICRDNIREMLSGTYKYVPDAESLVKIIAHLSLWEALDRKHNVIVDECHIKEEMRKLLLLQLKSREETTTTVVYFTEDKYNLEYRMRSSRGISEEKWFKIIENMKKDFEPPTSGELPHNVELITIDPLD